MVLSRSLHRVGLSTTHVCWTWSRLRILRWEINTGGQSMSSILLCTLLHLALSLPVCMGSVSTGLTPSPVVWLRDQEPCVQV
jgi:hypothetical protein